MSTDHWSTNEAVARILWPRAFFTLGQVKCDNGVTSQGSRHVQGIMDATSMLFCGCRYVVLADEDLLH